MDPSVNVMLDIEAYVYVYNKMDEDLMDDSTVSERYYTIH